MPPPPPTGTCHRSFPSARLMPTRDLSVSVTSCFVPSADMRTGEPYAGASPAHFHFSSPLFRSSAVTSPLPPPPRWAMHFPSTISGDDAVECAGTALLVSFRQTTLPSPASRQERTPLTPSA